MLTPDQALNDTQPEGEFGRKLKLYSFKYKTDFVLRSQAKKDGADASIAKYDGTWALEAALKDPLNGDTGKEPECWLLANVKSYIRQKSASSP